MNKNTLILPAILALTASLTLTGCIVRERAVYRPRPVYVAPAPVYVAPPPQVYVAPPQQVYVAPAPQEVIVSEAPPADIVEVQTVAPGPGLLWIGGAWAWHGRWVWEHGRWGRPPHAGVVWHANHYEYRNGVHVYVRGGWR